MRELRRLGNEAIAEGHRSAMRRLNEHFESPEALSLKEAANAELIRVETYFVTTRRFRGFPDLPVIPEEGAVAFLADILLDESRDWQSRAKAASLLGDYEKNPDAAAALAEASQVDPNLYVVQEIILAFARVTGFQTTGVFDSRSLTRWWEKNSHRFLRELPPLLPEE